MTHDRDATPDRIALLTFDSLSRLPGMNRSRKTRRTTCPSNGASRRSRVWGIAAGAVLTVDPGGWSRASWLSPLWVESRHLHRIFAPPKC